jgi:ATP-dependent Clp protease ATP-binding subunit ClpB
MNPENFTAMFQQSLNNARTLALGKNHQMIEPEHVLKAMLTQQDGSILPILQKANSNITKLSQSLDEAIAKFPAVHGSNEMHISANLQRVLNATSKLAQKRGDHFIASEIFLLGTLEENGNLAKILQHAALIRQYSHKRSKKLAETNL